MTEPQPLSSGDVADTDVDDPVVGASLTDAEIGG